ncbi:uncharacterized protein PAC_16390 [Phialocephala subalpina]|uniref:Uncharacterized protein n=1 Tax=Phialocephala subalpina TaxID=576137 RepID=A0A1L7XN78_9HELO|nr:uncharacterized protein PAC_16390 [Phialocephala subalpina]
MTLIRGQKPGLSRTPSSSTTAPLFRDTSRVTEDHGFFIRGQGGHFLSSGSLETLLVTKRCLAKHVGTARIDRPSTRGETGMSSQTHFTLVLLLDVTAPKGFRGVALSLARPLKAQAAWLPFALVWD